MLGGDISNATPPRIIVMVDVAIDSEVIEVKHRFRPKTSERKVLTLRAAPLSRLWNVANNYGLSVELAGLASDLWTQDHLDKLMARLDSRGANPFNYAELYASTPDFVSELPFRANLRGVIDLPGNVAKYGSWGLELENL